MTLARSGSLSGSRQEPASGLSSGASDGQAMPEPGTTLLRFARHEDAAAIQSIYAYFCDHTAITFEVVAPTVTEIAQRMAGGADYPWLVVERQGRVIGYAYACRHRERAAFQWSADVSIYLAPEGRRSGLGRLLYNTIFELLVQQGYYKVHAGITLPNAASEGLHAAMGFAPVGIFPGVGFKHGKWHDVVWLQRVLQPETPDPPPPRPLAELLMSGQAKAAVCAANAWLQAQVR